MTARIIPFPDEPKRESELRCLCGGRIHITPSRKNCGNLPDLFVYECERCRHLYEGPAVKKKGS